MSFELHALRSLEYVTENGSQFGTSQSGSATYKQLRFISSEAGFSVPMIPISIAQQSKFRRAAHIPGPKTQTLTVETYLYGAETPLSATIAPGEHDVGGLFNSILGGRYAQSGSSAAAGTVSGSIAVIANAGARFQPKEIIGWVNSTGKLECRAIKSISSDTLTLHSPFSANPAIGDVVYGSYTYYPQENPTGSLQFLQRGKGATDAWVGTGMHGKFSFTFIQTEIAKAKFEFVGANWLSGTGAAANQTYSTAKPPVFTNCDVFLFSTGSTSSTPIKFTTIEVVPNIKWNDVKGASGVNNVVARTLDAATAADGAMNVTIETYWDDFSYIQAMENGWEYQMLIQVGSQLGSTFVVFLPRVQIVEVVRNSADEYAGQKIKLVAFHDSISTGGSQSELTQAPYVLAEL